MACTVGIYKKNLLDSKINFQKIISTLWESFTDKIDSAIQVMEERAKVYTNIFSNRGKRKFQRDKIDLEEALKFSNKTFEQLIDNKTPVLNAKQLREKMLKGQTIPSFKPLNLHKYGTPKTDGLKLLCSKGPSFVPVPSHYNWLQLQKDVDRFRNSLGSRVLFSNKDQTSKNNFRNNNEVNNPPKKKSNWSALKTNSTELQTFLISVKEIYSVYLTK